MSNFVPDTGTVFYAIGRPYERVHGGEFGSTPVITKHQDRSYPGAVFEAIAKDSYQVLARSRHYDYGDADRIYKFPLSEWTFEPVGPEVQAILRASKDWTESACSK